MLKKMERGGARFCLRKSFTEPALIKMLERPREHNPEWQLTILTWRQSTYLNFSSAQGYIGTIQTNHLPCKNGLFLSCSISLFNNCNTKMKTYSKETIFKHLQCYRVHRAFKLAWINVSVLTCSHYILCVPVTQETAAWPRCVGVNMAVIRPELALISFQRPRLAPDTPSLSRPRHPATEQPYTQGKYLGK